MHRHIGGPVIMAAQFEKVLEAEKQGKVTVQVIPFNIGVNAAQDSNFVLLEFDEKPDLSPMVFVEGLTANQYLERVADIVRYKEAIRHLADSALSPADSIKFIYEMREVLVTKHA